ncbi:MAG: N-acetylmuramoyl-L-alanine amidase [Cyanobacteriota bacterium]|nr:N-acetylmuramoyl-L-alanine amidase [Cyanobacteriota bacterium]
MVKFPWFVPSVVSVLMLSSPGGAALASSFNPSFEGTPASKNLRTPPEIEKRDRSVSESLSKITSHRIGEIATSHTTESENLTAPKVAHEANQLTTVESIDISDNQIAIEADGPLDYQSGWSSPLYYEVTIDSARLSSDVSIAEPPNGGTISRVRVEQLDADTIWIRIRPVPQVDIQVNQPSSQMLSVYVQSYAADAPPIKIPIISSENNLDNIDLPTDLAGKIVVVIDPGHGGPDVGAVGIGGLQEIQVVDPVAYRTAQILEEQGIGVVLTRSDNYDLDLEPRVQLANRLGANLFVSIHANAISMSRPDVNGVETYYFNTGDILAQVIHSYLLQATGGPDRGVKTARFYVLRNTDMPAVLVELGFVTGRFDAPRLADAEYQELLAQAVAQGILAYIAQYCPGPACES